MGDTTIGDGNQKNLVTSYAAGPEEPHEAEGEPHGGQPADDDPGGGPHHGRPPQHGPDVPQTLALPFPHSPPPPPPPPPPAMGTSAVPEATEARPPMENDENQKPFPLSGPALLAFLKAVSDVSVTPITVLNVYSASCVLTRAETPVNIVLKAAFLGLPFSILPILLITRRIIRVVEQGGCSLDIGALLVLSQFIYIYMLGGVTMMTMFQDSRIFVASVTIVVICICVKIWVCLSNHPKFLMVISSNRVDLKNGLDMISVQSIANVTNTKGVSKMGPEHSMQVNLIKITLNICFVLYLVFYIGFMLVLAIVAENWWHGLLGIAVMSPIHVSGLRLICYLRDGLIRVHTMERPNGDHDLGCKLVASENV